MDKLLRVMRPLFYLVSLLVYCTAPTLYALSDEQKKTLDSGIRYFNTEIGFESGCAVGAASGDSNLDYAGREILTSSQLNKIAEYQPTYEQAASQVDIPWQMLAVVHLREHNLGKDNPGNGQGIYQFSGGQGGPYPTGPVSDAEFMRQTILAAEFLKNKASSNYSGNTNLTSSSAPAVIKDTFFGYNGRAAAYEQQAASLGFNPTTEGYEGSPYVMNKADAERDPDVNPNGWGQIKTDGGGIEYPANQQYGAFLMYASLAGISTNCVSAGSGALIWPLPQNDAGHISSCFGPRNIGDGFHDGLDIANGVGTPVLAVASGQVVFAGSNDVYGPNLVKIKHSDKLETLYGHMSSKSVANGATVTQGQQVGTVGNEGVSFGPHLHIDVVVDGKVQNPIFHLTVPDKVKIPPGCNYGA